MLKIGFRAHDFGQFESVEELAGTIESYYPESIIQLALNKVVPTARKWNEWDEEYISSVRETLSSHGVSVAVVGCYINPIHPDEEKRKSEVQRFIKGLELNKAFGCRVVATETGTVNTKGGYSLHTSDPKNLEIFYASLSDMVEAAEKYDGWCTIEAVNHTHTMTSIERMAAMIEKFPSSHLKVLFDPVNLVPYTGIKEKDGSEREVPSPEAQRAFYAPILDLYGSRLVAIHCKDYILSEEGTKIGNLPALTGVFDWQGFMTEIKKHHMENVPWSLENMNPLTLHETVSKLQEMWEKA